MVDIDHRLPVFAFGACQYTAAKKEGSQLHSVTDAKDRYSKFEYRWIAFWGIVIRDAAWAAGKDDAARVARLNLGDRGIVANDLAVDFLFSNSARDQLCDLRAKVENCYPVMVLHYFCLLKGKDNNTSAVSGNQK